MSTIKEQQETSVGGRKNLGSNRTAEGTRQVTNRERVQHQVVEAHGATEIGYTPDQHVRSAEAVHWNLLTDLKPEHLQYAG